MTHNETRVSNELLAEMLVGLEGVTPGPWDNTANLVRAIDGDLAIPILEGRDPWKKHRRTSTVMRQAWHNLDHVSRCDPDTIRAMILELQELRAHPLPNPSPSYGEVSDVLRRARNYIDDMPHLFPENAHPNDRDTHRQLEAEREPLLLALTAAIQSKRGQP